jgi:hypothetical protein
MAVTHIGTRRLRQPRGVWRQLLRGARREAGHLQQVALHLRGWVGTADGHMQQRQALPAGSARVCGIEGCRLTTAIALTAPGR